MSLRGRRPSPPRARAAPRLEEVLRLGLLEGRRVTQPTSATQEELELERQIEEARELLAKRRTDRGEKEGWIIFHRDMRRIEEDEWRELAHLKGLEKLAENKLKQLELELEALKAGSRK